LSLLNYDESFVQRELDLSQASYCISSASDSWSCSTCDSGISLEAVVENNGARALVGYDSKQDVLFVAYRGSSDIQNWIDNIQFAHTSPYSDLPDVSVEKGFYKWYTSLKDDVDSALLYSQSKFGTSKVKVTGHSAGGAAATLHAFDIARGESSTSGLTLTSAVTFGSPRVGNSAFMTAHDEYIDQSVIPSWRVTHYYDMVPHLPEEMFGYNHVNTEVWYNEASTSYSICDESGEDPTCSNSCSPIHCDSISDHLDYLNTPLGSTAC
jgi:predicted lipase